MFRRMDAGVVCAAVVGLACAACSSSSTEFKDQSQQDGGSLLGDADVDRDPVTLGVDTDGSDTAQPDLPGPADGGDAVVPEGGEFVLRDHQTGSLWNLRGEAYAGPLAGQQLQQLPSFNSFWFAWSAFYHGSTVWNRDELNLPGAIEREDNCLVPCGEIRPACSGRDCIPALDYDGRDGRPVAEMGTAAQGDYLSETDTILGVVIDGEPRAYPHNLLWWHEIYNDKIGGREFTVTLCPLTGSGMVFGGELSGAAIDFGVSGNLYNSNLVMFDRDGDTLWSQMIFTGVQGAQLGERLELLPVVETTWGRWKVLYPETLVALDATGYQRDYSAYPYGGYRTNHNDTFRPTNPAFETLYDAKDLVLGLVGDDSARAYAFEEMGQFGARVVVNDEFEGTALVVVYEAEFAMAIPFSAQVGEQELTFEGAVQE
jgi:hypothetical protein